MTSESTSARRYHFRLTPFWFAFALFFIALLPRLAAIGRYVTPDEVIWVYRSVQFRQALASSAWLDTLTAGHPGVTTTWLGSLAISLQLAVRPGDQAVYEWITHLAWFAPENVAAFSQLATFLTAARLVVALANSLGVVAMYLLARPLLGQYVAIVGGLLIALDPFIAGLSGLLHVDALMTTFATLSLLALALVVTKAQGDKLRHLQYAVVSGVTAALAILSKSPALLLLPFAALFLCLTLFHNGDVPLADRLRRLLKQGGAWLVSFLATTLLAFPALWAAPAQVVAAMSSNANRHIEEALRPTFFLGQVAFEHGPLFYPVTLALRLSPIVFLGLILAFYLIVRHFLGGSFEKKPQITRITQVKTLQVVTLLLGLWPALYIIGISFAAKKFDRYALPAIPALTFLAAIAWQRFSYRRRPKLARLAAPLLVVGQVVYLLWALPYPLAAYNPLSGGPLAAQQALPLGWGESISAAGRWLATQPGIAGKAAAASTAPALAPFFPGRTLPLAEENVPQADYLILTAGMKQSEPEALAHLAANSRLVHTIHYGGLDQAWIYAQADPQKSRLDLPDLATPLTFGNRMQLLATEAATAGEQVHLYARWQRRQPDGRYTVRVALQDDEGHEWAELETALLNEVYFYPEHWAADETPIIRYTLDLPPAIPPAGYTVTLSLFDSHSGTRLPLLAADGQFQGVVYDKEVVGVPPPAIAPPVAKLDIPVAAGVAWREGSLILLGHSPLQATVINGGRLPLDLYWQAQTELPEGMLLTLTLGDRPFTVPLSRYDSGRWRPGEVIHEKVSLVAPPDMAAGWYSLTAEVFAADGRPLAGAPYKLGDVEVIALDRLFELPAGIATPLTYRFSQDIHLAGLDLLTPAVTPGETMQLKLYWQTETQPDQIYTAFVHVLGPDGEIAFQADQWPGGLPSHTWAAGQVIIDEYALDVPADLPAGDYRIAVGVYAATDGQRLPVSDGDGTVYRDNRVILPVSLALVAADE
jgi:4-amino-4-deoxy-L-arabinose transferase-like glycosyltransferase